MSGRAARPPRWMRPGAAAAGLLVAALVARGAAEAQERSMLRLEGPDGAGSSLVEVEWHRGYAAVPAATLTRLGWDVRTTSGGVRAEAGDVTLGIGAGDPFFSWNGEILQLVDEPYHFGDGVWVPLQLLADFLPAQLRDAYAFEADPPTLRVLDPDRWMPEGAPVRSARVAEPPPRPRRAAPPEQPIVFVDAGHGGRDPGTRGPRGEREKDVALALALALADELSDRPGIEVRLTRDDDRLVPIWQRGQWATELKGGRPGVFVSLHANAAPSRISARGFETYFLSDARTEHERRVAALENAPLDLEREAETRADAPELDVILKELRNFDHAHWSQLLAQLVQERLAPVHPGPDRGVKQAPFAVITNALMPAVLVEIGFITHREEARLITRPSFQADAARALADAVVEFLERYAPETSRASGGGP